jgi:hypothetical protein
MSGKLKINSGGTGKNVTPAVQLVATAATIAGGVAN